MRYPVKQSQCGFSIVELMVALALSMTLAVAIVSVFVNNSHSFNQDENVARMQDDARHALREIAFEVSMAGHYAELHTPSTVTPCRVAPRIPCPLPQSTTQPTPMR